MYTGRDSRCDWEDWIRSYCWVNAPRVLWVDGAVWYLHTLVNFLSRFSLPSAYLFVFPSVSTSCFVGLLFVALRVAVYLLILQWSLRLGEFSYSKSTLLDTYT